MDEIYQKDGRNLPRPVEGQGLAWRGTGTVGKMVRMWGRRDAGLFVQPICNACGTTQRASETIVRQKTRGVETLIVLIAETTKSRIRQWHFRGTTAREDILRWRHVEQAKTASTWYATSEWTSSIDSWLAQATSWGHSLRVFPRSTFWMKTILLGFISDD
jgi:hypothetical protein